MLLCHTVSEMTLIWSNLGLSDYKRMEKKLGLKKKQQKTPVVISKRNYLVPYSKENPLTLMHLWHLSATPSFWVELFAKRLLKGVS